MKTTTELLTTYAASIANIEDATDEQLLAFSPQPTPADFGILAATLDDARRLGLGDDDTERALVATCRELRIDEAAAYPFMRNN